MARLDDLCRTPHGHARARALQPSGDLDDVRRLQALTAEARGLGQLKPNFNVGHVEDLDASITLAARRGQLPSAELIAVGAVLRTVRQTRNHLAPLTRDLPLLAGIAQRVSDFGPLLGQIEATFDERGEIRNTASPALPALRITTRRAHDRVLAHTQRVLNRALADGIAQEAIVTERDGRYVIPIKAKSRGQLRGVVHDVSSSGATVFVEPLAVVEEGNAWREARLEEQREVERVLRALSNAVGEQAGPIAVALRALGEIDLALAKAALGAEMDAPLPAASTSDPTNTSTLDWIVEAPAELRLQSARHPLLSGEVVPISLALGDEQRGLLITGPNTGGKTVAIKTAGLLALMALAGLPIPAEPGTQIPVYADVFADIGDEQSIEQSLSTFSSHMTNVIRILEQAGAQSLVLMDELGAGTDPTEGAALGRAILLQLMRLDATVIATTHHGELKLFAHATPGLRNASVEFNAETLSPTYHLAIGLPGRSNAIAIAERLGMPGAVLSDARASVAPDEAQMETLLAEIQAERSAAGDVRRAEEFAREEAESIREQLQRRREAFESERETILDRTQQAMEQELTRLRKAMRAAEKDLAQQRRESIGAAQQQLDAAAEQLEDVRRERLRMRRARQTGPKPDPASIKPGDVLFIEGVDQPGEALTAVEADGCLDVQLGALRTRVRAVQIVRLSHSPAGPAGLGNRTPGSASRAVHYDLAPTDPGSRIEVRGHTLDEAMPVVEQFLDQAFRAGQQRLEIVHGKGTGVLRDAVRRRLRDHPLVTRFEPAVRQEGGEGVTIVYMAV